MDAFDGNETIKLIRKMETRDCSPHAREEFERARKIAEELGNALNGGTQDIIVAGLLAGFLKTHRYLNEKATISLLTALGEFGALPENMVSDDRNRFTYKLLGKLRKALREDLFWRDPE